MKTLEDALAQTNLSGIKISYDDMGRGEPALLFMPGWCVNRTVFHDLLVHCSTRRRVLSLDWRGHGESGPPAGDFALNGLVDDALAVIKASGVRFIVPVALAHAGWVAIELKHKLKIQVPKLVLIDWLVAEAPAPFLETLEAMEDRTRWREAVNDLLKSWQKDTNHPRLIQFIRDEIGAYGFEMWARAARTISTAYSVSGSPLGELSALQPPVPVLHLYAQPPDEEYLALQQAFAADNPWFHVQRLAAKSHFPMFEVPTEITSAIEKFVQ